MSDIDASAAVTQEVPMSPAQAAANNNRNTVNAGIGQAITDLRAIANNTGVLTATQLSAHQRRLAVILLRALRLVDNRFDSTD